MSDAAGLVVKPLTDPRWIERIKMLDKQCFPVRYSESYYTKLVDNGLPMFNVVAFYHEVLVGSCTCRLEASETDPAQQRLYIMTIGTLEAYRRKGIASRMLERVVETVAKERNIEISHIALHVQVGSPARQFYERHGFDIKEEVKDYYTELDVNDALLLTKVVQQPNLKRGKK